MPLNYREKQLKITIHRALKIEPLKSDEQNLKYYTPIYQMMGYSDPISRIAGNIEYTPQKSIQFFSGFRHSGKTTELYRLKKTLENKAYYVIYADALDYISPTQRIEITDLLMILAGAFSDSIENDPNIKINLKGESYWTRFCNYLTETEIDISELSAKAGKGVEVGLKMQLRDNPSFRQNLQKHLRGRIAVLKDKVDEFIKEGVEIIKKTTSEDIEVVFIFDSLERIRGTESDSEGVIQSVEEIFSHHYELLELPHVHAVYTVPPWLKFIRPNDPIPIIFLYNIKQWNKYDRTVDENGRIIFRNIMIKRFGEEGFKAFWGEEWKPDKPLRADCIIDCCGGDFRDFLSILDESLMSVENFPVNDIEIRQIIAKAKNRYLPIADDEAEWLARIEESRDASLPTKEAKYISKLTFFLDNKRVLYFQNGSEWYDIHPLIRVDVIDKNKRLKRDNSE